MSATQLVSRLKVAPQESETRQSLMAGGQTTLAQLRGLKGAAFDKAYVDHEIVYHYQVLVAVDRTLIPSVRNEELKALLVNGRPAFTGHLQHAIVLRASLDRKD
jgi:putative membrane protein